MKVTVFDIEGGIAVIELANGKLQNILKALLPYGVKKGDVIDINNGAVTTSDCAYSSDYTDA